MAYIPRIVVAKMDEAGEPAFEEFRGGPENRTDLTWLRMVWETSQIPEIPARIGEHARDVAFPKPGDVKVGIVRIGGRTAGKLNITSAYSKDKLAGISGLTVPGDNPAMIRPTLWTWSTSFQGELT
jgi:hypothetical protein